MLSLRELALWENIKNKSINYLLSKCLSDQTFMDVCISSPGALQLKVTRMLGNIAVIQRPDLTSGSDWLNYLKNINNIYRYVYYNEEGNLTRFDDYVGDEEDFNEDQSDIDILKESDFKMLLSVQSLPLPPVGFGEYGRIIVVEFNSPGSVNEINFFYTGAATIIWAKDRAYSGWTTITRTSNCRVHHTYHLDPDDEEEINFVVNNHLELDAWLTERFTGLKDRLIDGYTEEIRIDIPFSSNTTRGTAIIRI